MFSRQTKTASQDDVCVPDRVRQRVAMVQAGTEAQWVDQTLYLIGHNLTHHKPGDPLLEEAVQSAQALLALLVKMRSQEIR